MCRYHPIPFIFNSIDEAAEFFEGTGNNDLVICLAVADAFKLKTHQTGGQAALRPGQSCVHQQEEK